VNVFSCEEKQKITLAAYDLEGLRVSQFGDHYFKLSAFIRKL